MLIQTKYRIQQLRWFFEANVCCLTTLLFDFIIFVLYWWITTHSSRIGIGIGIGIAPENFRRDMNPFIVHFRFHYIWNAPNFFFLLFLSKHDEIFFCSWNNFEILSVHSLKRTKQPNLCTWKINRNYKN